MKLKVTIPNKVIYDGKIKSVTIPTENGAETISNLQTRTLVIGFKPGLLRIVPENIWDNHDFIISKNEIIISIDKWMAFADGETIRIVSSQATAIPNESKSNLEETKESIEKQIKKLRINGSIEQIEQYMTKLQKINADISLEEIKLNRE